MTGSSLAVFGLTRKPHVAKCDLRHFSAMGDSLLERFSSRLQEEMERRELSANQLAKLSQVGQTSISRILAGKQDPSLEIVDSLSKAMGIPAWFLMVAANSVQTTIIQPPGVDNSTSVISLPKRYPPIFTAEQQGPAAKKTRARGVKRR